jgi:hypothetical protein
MTPEQLFSTMTEKQKLVLIRDVFNSFTPGFKKMLLEELLPEPTGPVDIQITSNDDAVRVTFDRRVAWLNFPKQYALQFGKMLMEHGGATFEKAQNPTEK